MILIGGMVVALVGVFVGWGWFVGVGGILVGDASVSRSDSCAVSVVGAMVPSQCLAMMLSWSPKTFLISSIPPSSFFKLSSWLTSYNLLNRVPNSFLSNEDLSSKNSFSPK